MDPYAILGIVVVAVFFVWILWPHETKITIIFPGKKPRWTKEQRDERDRKKQQPPDEVLPA